MRSLYNKPFPPPLRFYLYRLRPLYALCVLVIASLAGVIAAHGAEVQPTAQVFATPTVVEAQPTEVLPAEPTAENIPTTPPTLVPTIQVPATATFRVIEIVTRVAATHAPTYAPTFVPTAVPTSAEPTLDLDPTATATADTRLPPALTTEPTATDVGEIASATPTIDEPAPFPFSTDTPTSVVTTTSIVTEGIAPADFSSPTGTPGWLAPGPECNLLQSEIAVRLDVPYIHQVLDIGVGDGNWACGPTSIAMILAYYGKLDPWPEYVAREAANYIAAPTSTARTTSILTASAHTSTPTARKPTSSPTVHTPTPGARSTLTSRPVRSVTSKTTTAKSTATTVRRSGLGFGQYVTNAYWNNGYMYNSTARDPRGDRVAGLYGTICPTGFADWSRMRFVLEQHGLSSRHISASWDGVVDALKRGHPVILGADLTAAGHILVAIGYTENGQLIVNDPYGNRFAPGYGGTRGEGLFYPWDCSRVRNAMEVVGEYPPSPRSVQSGSSLHTLSPATSLAPYSGRTYYRAEDRELTVQQRAAVPLVATPSVAKSNSIPTAKLPTKPIATPSATSTKSAKIVPDVAVAAASTGGNLNANSEQHVFGWGLFSMLSMAVVVVGVRDFRKTRRAATSASIAVPIVVSSSSAPTLAAEEHDVVAASGIESSKQADQHAVSKPKRSLMPTPSSGLQLVLRRTLPLALPLFILVLKLYQTSKGQEDARTRITDETKQFMIRNL